MYNSLTAEEKSQLPASTLKTLTNAEKAYKALNGKYYCDKQVVAEYSPVTNFKECRCRQYEDGSCGRGGFCNFMHLKCVSKSFIKSLMEQKSDFIIPT